MSVRLLFRKRSLMTPHLEACLSGGGRIRQVGIGRNNLLKPVRRASCKRILCSYPGVWRARNCDGKYGRRPFKKRTADIAAAFEEIGQIRGRDWQVSGIAPATKGHVTPAEEKLCEILRQ